MCESCGAAFSSVTEHEQPSVRCQLILHSNRVSYSAAAISVEKWEGVGKENGDEGGVGIKGT